MAVRLPAVKALACIVAKRKEQQHNNLSACRWVLLDEYGHAIYAVHLVFFFFAFAGTAAVFFVA